MHANDIRNGYDADFFFFFKIFLNIYIHTPVKIFFDKLYA